MRDQFKKTRDEVIGLVRGGKPEVASKETLEKQEPRYARMRLAAEDLKGVAKSDVAAAIGRSEQRISSSQYLFLLIGAVALVAGVGMALVLSRSIAGPLKDLAGAAERIASGDLGDGVGVNGRRDEVGLLAHSFQRMTRSCSRRPRWPGGSRAAT